MNSTQVSETQAAVKISKVLLVLPAAKHVRVTSADRSVPRRKMLRFSILGLTTVAAATPPQYEVTICDENVEPLDLDTDAEVVGISFMTAIAPRAFEIARELHRRGKIVVAGGFHPTLCPEDTARHFDAVVAGDAEGLWPKVLADIEAGRLGKTKIYRHRDLPDLACVPAPRRDLTAHTAKYYATINAVQTTRGCANGCTYCSITAFHRQTQRTRPVEDVLAELKTIGRDFIFVDDNIIGDVEYAKKLFAAMAPLKKRWISQCSLRIADDPELLKLARDAGCLAMFIGIETLSGANLSDFGKEFNDAASYRKRIAAIRRAGIGVQAGIIVGADGDDPGVFERMLGFLRAARIDALQLNILTPLPGTPLFEQFDRAGRITDTDWSKYDFRHVVIRPAGMTAGQLQDGADWLYAQFYRLDRIILRALRTLLSGKVSLAVLAWQLGMTYRYDNIREGIVGRNPVAKPASGSRFGAALRRAWSALTGLGERSRTEECPDAEGVQENPAM
ncbi:MAG: B12-binding domain-containing radical SAM protein [Phycisphaerae bacterium]|nr:B12-binding domain-containing radical SAM protein [Phycisphaerae bacterium]